MALSLTKKLGQFLCGPSKKVDKDFEEKVNQKIDQTLFLAELDVLAELESKIEKRKEDVKVMQTEIVRAENEAVEQSENIEIEERNLREELEKKTDRLRESEEKQLELNEEIKKGSTNIERLRQTHISENNESNIKHTLDFNVLRDDLNGKIESEVNLLSSDVYKKDCVQVSKAKEELEDKLNLSRKKLLELQEAIKLEQVTYINSLTNVDDQREQLERLQSAITKQAGERAKKEPKKEVQEIRILRRGECPGFELIGRDIDAWLKSTKLNCKACVNKFRSEPQVRYVSVVTPPGDGALCQCCGCSVGPHNRRKCSICKMLDLSDATLLP